MAAHILSLKFIFFLQLTIKKSHEGAIMGGQHLSIQTRGWFGVGLQSTRLGGDKTTCFGSGKETPYHANSTL